MAHFKSTAFLLAALAAALPACGGVQPHSRVSEAPVTDVQDKWINFRSALRELRAQPLAGEAGPDLDRVQAWLDLAERRLADTGRTDDVALVVDAIAGQLVLVRSYYGKRDAEADLESLRQKAAGGGAEADTDTREEDQ